MVLNNHICTITTTSRVKMVVLAFKLPTVGICPLTKKNISSIIIRARTCSFFSDHVRRYPL